MSAIREKALAILTAAIPPGAVITSNGATAKKFTELTGTTHQTLLDNWAKGGQLTTCNGFTGWFGRKMGVGFGIGGFDLQGIAAKAGRPDAWVVAADDVYPDTGDILRHASFHVDVALEWEGALLLRAASGQGGKNAGCDIIKRVGGTAPYQSSKLQGWLDIEKLLGDATASSGPEWFQGWWKVWDGNTYYYYFEPLGQVSYVKSRPLTKNAPKYPVSRGRYRYEDSAGRLTIDWQSVGEGSTRETFWNAAPNAGMMNATSSRYSPLVATRL
jgi:hypothetical protein